MAKGKLPLNDLAGGAGRMDVLIRALMSSILTSHGIRKDVEFTMIFPATAVDKLSSGMCHVVT